MKDKCLDPACCRRSWRPHPLLIVSVVLFSGVMFTVPWGECSKSEAWEKHRVSAYEFVLGELGRFEEEGDTKLAPRYERMAAYYKSRGFDK